MVLSNKVKAVLFSISLGAGLSLPVTATSYFWSCELEFEMCLEEGGDFSSCNRSKNTCNYMCSTGKWSAQYCY